MLNNANHDKNRFVFDVKLQSSKQRWYVWLAFVLAVLILALPSLLWWQMVILLGLCVVLAYLYHWRYQKITAMATKQADGVWQLMLTDGLHQAYLQQVQHIAYGFGAVLIMRFYVFAPKRQTMTVLIFSDMLNRDDFGRLVVLSRLGGYR